MIPEPVLILILGSLLIALGWAGCSLRNRFWFARIRRQERRAAESHYANVYNIRRL